jgi:hypothetical protein
LALQLRLQNCHLDTAGREGFGDSAEDVDVGGRRDGSRDHLSVNVIKLFLFLILAPAQPGIKRTNVSNEISQHKVRYYYNIRLVSRINPSLLLKINLQIT